MKEKGKFILRYGILYWGMPMGICIVFLSMIIKEGLAGLNDWANVASCIMVGIIYGILIGAVYGVMKWSRKEKK